MVLAAASLGFEVRDHLLLKYYPQMDSTTKSKDLNFDEPGNVKTLPHDRAFEIGCNLQDMIRLESKCRRARPKHNVYK